MSGQPVDVMHFEIPFDDGDRARGFYEQAFGWQVMVPELDYTLVLSGPSGEQGPSEVGFINRGMMKREEPFLAPNIVIEVDNIEKSLQAIGEAGDTTVSERQAVGDSGFSAYFKESEGSLIGIWENAHGERNLTLARQPITVEDRDDRLWPPATRDCQVGPMDGYAHPDFAAVEETFRNQLDKTNGGAAVAVYHRGQRVVDLSGGVRNNDGDRWKPDTIAMCYSTTKGVASFALHLQVEAGLVAYDDPVATYWPEFAQNGKEGVTVRHVLSHSAGLHRVRSVVERAHHMLDWEHMVDALAQERPAYEPGTKCGYHAMTYGWLAGEIVRRVTGKNLGEVVADGIATPLDLDGLYLGCPPEERHRVAPLESMTSGRQILPKRMRGVEKKIGEQFAKGLSLARSPINPRRMINALIPRGMEDIIATPELMDAEVPAVNGFFTARSLAAMYGVLAGRGQLNGVRLLSPELVDQIGEVQIAKRDLVLVVPMKWRLGYHRLMTSKGPSDTGFGHFGFGGSGGWADPTKDLAVAMVCNRGNGTPVGDMRLMRLSTSAYESVDGRAEAADETAA